MIRASAFSMKRDVTLADMGRQRTYLQHLLIPPQGRIERKDKAREATYKILPPSIRQRTRQLAQRYAHTGRDQSKEDQAIDNLNRPPAIDASDQSSRNAPPRVRESEADAKEGKPGVIPLQVLGVAHLGEGSGIGVLGFEVIVGGGGGGDVLDVVQS